MYKKGDKVRPLSKCIGDAWEDSLTIECMKNQDQNFLYFIRETSYGSFVCSAENSLLVGEFLPSDLEPYELYHVIELNKDLILELLQRDFFKEDVKFYVSK